MKFMKPLVVLLLCLFTIGLAWTGKSLGQGKNRIELLPSEGFEIKSAKIEENEKNPHLQYRIVNTSGIYVPKVIVKMVAYDEKGNVIGGMQWATRTNLNVGASTHGILAVASEFASAKRITLSFSCDVEVDYEEANCTDNFCQNCTTNAAMGCAGGGGVQNYSCQMGGTCRCKYTCYPPRPE